MLNLNDVPMLPPPVRERLEEAGIDSPERQSISVLIERVWKLQEPYLQPQENERRTRRRRSVRPQIESWLIEGGKGG